MNLLVKLLFVLMIIYSFTGCNKTLNLHLSKSEIKALDTIYYQKRTPKLSKIEWVFYKKNICQLTNTFLRRKTYTGTWTKIGDSIQVHFFYQGKNKRDDRRFAIKDLEEVQDSIK